MKPVHNKSSRDTIHPPLSPIFLKWTTYSYLCLQEAYLLFPKQKKNLKCRGKKKKKKYSSKKTKKTPTITKRLYLWPFGAFLHREYLQSQSHASLQLLGKESRVEIIWIDAQKISACLKSCPLYFARSPRRVWGNMQSQNHTGRKRSGEGRGNKTKKKEKKPSTVAHHPKLTKKKKRWKITCIWVFLMKWTESSFFCAARTTVSEEGRKKKRQTWRRRTQETQILIHLFI